MTNDHPPTDMLAPMGNLSVQQQIRHLHKNKHIPTALLLAGPSQIGKTTYLKQLALLLQCQNMGCMTCSTCRQILAGVHQGTHNYTETESFKIKQVRALQEQAHLTTSANYHIFIIKNIERLTIPASNALLKLLEEPPQKTKFLLTTSNENSLLATIRSRCQTLRMQNLSENELKEFATRTFPDQKPAKIDYELSLGKPGRLHKLLTDDDYRHLLHSWYNKIEDLDDFPLNHKHFLLTKELSKNDRNNICEFLVIYQTYLHNLHKPQLTHHKSIKIQEAINAVQANHNPQLVLENLFFQTTQA